MEQEIQERYVVEKRLVNLLSALMPCYEGLYLMTVLDGKTGLVLFRYHASAKVSFQGLLASLARDFPGGFRSP